MGQRANLFETARKTINIIKSKAASKHTYMCNFPMSIMKVTRRHLHSICLELVDAFENNRYAVIPALMKRYYKLNALHVSQLTRYLKMCNPIETQLLEHNKMYLLQLSRMFSQLYKSMTLYQKRNLNTLVEQMSDKFTVLFDFRIQPGRTRSRKTRSALDVTNSVELGPWLDNFDNKAKLNNMRLFYVIKPNAENVVKFGVAGTTGGTSGFGRLRQYIHSYGYSEDLNRCRGVQLMYLAGNKYNPTVDLVKSDVWKKERACKQYFRAPEVKAHLIGRGFERFDLDRLQELFDIIDDPSNKDFGDEETERRVSERLAQQNLTTDDYIVKIIDHTTAPGKSRKMTKYLCYWNRGAVLTKKKLVKKLNPNPKKDSDLRDLQADKEREAARFQTEESERVVDHTTYEFYKDIVNFKGGAKAMDIYKTLHPKGHFRDK